MYRFHRHLLKLCSIKPYHKIVNGYCKSQRRNWKILFFGTDSFSLETLKLLNENRKKDGLVCELQVVCASKFVKVRRKLKQVSPVWTYVQDNDLKTIPWPVVDKQSLKGFDVGVLSSFGHLIPSDVLDSLPLGIINVHPSLLPRWRGANPIMHAILNGDKETGVTIMQLSERFDCGPILNQKHYPVPAKCTAADLRQLLAKEGGALLIETLRDLEQCIANKREQDEREVVDAPKRKPGIEIVDWSKSCESISRLYRAISDEVTLQTVWKGDVVKLSKMVTVESQSIGISDVVAGQISYSKSHKALCVHCRDGWLGFQEIVFNGKRLSAADFNNGFLAGPKIKTVEIFQSNIDDKS
ncbi:methionyl-tRNA formyltransferase, mitochondrial-like [Antedon mediterranea]|uniref:methionyl-tRNA formyltransferase, mitochondrial-like n=1 Tax=Antedon mediterranea TaxID=105859 RepID=UPI003AF46301